MVSLTPPQADVAVRPADRRDSASLGDVQARAWRATYGDLLPPPLLETVDADFYAERWQKALTSPPSDRHRVLVATADGRPVGFAAVEPATDADADPDESELSVLVVDPAHRRQGHGSRLLSAVSDTCRAEGVNDLITWLFARDADGRAYLEGSGWGADGATRVLDADVVLLAQLRLRTTLT